MGENQPTRSVVVNALLAAEKAIIKELECPVLSERARAARCLDKLHDAMREYGFLGKDGEIPLFSYGV